MQVHALFKPKAAGNQPLLEIAAGGHAHHVSETYNCRWDGSLFQGAPSIDAWARAGCVVAHCSRSVEGCIRHKARQSTAVVSSGT